MIWVQILVLVFAVHVGVTHHSIRRPASPHNCVPSPLYPLRHHPKVRPLPRFNSRCPHPDLFPSGRTQLPVTQGAQISKQITGESVTVFCYETQMSLIILSKGIQNSKPSELTIALGNFWPKIKNRPPVSLLDLQFIKS